ncbi:MAG: LCP family protein [Carbonactinosporaceae bacterium]
MSDHGGRAAARRARRRSRWRRTVLVTSAVVAFVMVAGTAAAFVVYQQLSGNIGSEDVDSRLGNRPDKLTKGAINILLIGSDTRAGANSKYGNTSGQRSDTTILLHLSADRKDAVAISIPRDSWVEIPSCPLSDGGSTEPQENRFNAAYTYGGSACTIKTVEGLTDLRIDHHVVVDFAGFKSVVSTLGGIEVCLPEAVDDPKSELHLPAGRSVVKGEQALAYVRTRTSMGDGSDLSRIERQQDFLSAAIQRMQSTELLLNPKRLYDFLNAATESITTDPGLDSLHKMYDLARSAKSLRPNEITFLTVPVYDRADGATVAFSEPAASDIFDALNRDEPLPGSKEAKKLRQMRVAKSKLTVPPEQIQVRVLNGTKVAGMAGRTSEKLAELGFEVVEVGNAQTQDHTETVVEHGASLGADARTLTQALPGSKNQTAGGGGDALTLVLGEDFSEQVREVYVKGEADASADEAPSYESRRASEKVCP